MLLPGISVTQPVAAALFSKGSSKMLIPLVPWLHAITKFVVSGDDLPLLSSASCQVSSSCAAGARVIEFYVPATFQSPERRWLPPEAKGKLIEFPAHGARKSA
jgi:hypothetical protein